MVWKHTLERPTYRSKTYLSGTISEHNAKNDTLRNKHRLRATTSYLESEEIPLHTCQLKEEKQLKVVIKGIPTEISDAEIKEDLIRQKLPVSKVTRMYMRQNSEKMCDIQLQRTGQGKRIFGITSTLHLKSQKIENYIRVIASKVYDVAHCRKIDGVIVEQISGAYKIRDTVALERRRLLEN
ncbi:hypothetical protein CBL_08588 [Carabus blaptoides fortunei]